VRALRSGLVAALLVAACACSGARSEPRTARDTTRTSWVVIAPHPDDEALIGSGTLARAIESGERAAVVVLTNGDLDCLHDGLVREGESVAGLAAVGLPESRVYFLGYPDGGLADLGAAPLPPRKRKIAGVCEEGNTTYGARGAGNADVHKARTGSAAPYTRAAAASDLASVLRELRPENVIVTHPEDTHPDHAMAYSLLREAMEALDEPPKVHRAMVHNDDCWPTGPEPHEPCTAPVIDPELPTPPLTNRLEGYAFGERLLVGASARVRDTARNVKIRAIAAHASQTRGTMESYLFGFARRDEAFFPETFVREGGRYRRDDAVPRPAHASLLLRDGVPAALATLGAITVAMRLPWPNRGGDVVTVHVLADASGAYVLSLDAKKRDATLRRVDASGTARLERRWPLPHDVWARASTPSEDVELAVESLPRDGGVAEVTLRMRGVIVGVAVDVHPRTNGESLRITGADAVTAAVAFVPRR